MQVMAEQFDSSGNGYQSGPYSAQMFVNANDAYGMDSGDNIAANLTSTPASEDFYIVPVALSDVEFVNSHSGSSKSNVLGTTSTVAILKVTADAWANTATNGSNLDLLITQLALNEYLGSATTVAGGYEISKIGGNEVYTAASVGGA